MDMHELEEIAAGRYEDFVAALERMVNVDCGSYTPDGVNEIADLCEERFATRGWTVRASRPRAERR